MSSVVADKPRVRESPRGLIRPSQEQPPRGSVNLLWWPAALAAILALTPVLFDRAGSNPILARSIWGVSATVLACTLALAWRVSRTGKALTYELQLNPVHYVQLCMHTAVYTYWGWYWREVYHYIPLIAVQLVFAYALDMLLSWARRGKWIAGFGPFPIILSTNLFLWFRDDYFYLQFLLIAVGVLGKEFIRWKREGRSVHIFNPSALSLFVFSIVLIATKSTDMTWGLDIANTLHRPPYIYLEIFLLGLIVQSLFRVTLVTLFSAVALCVLNLAYTHATGSYNFIDSNIPPAVFLGLHLLVTDPATSPRKALGKIIFGLLYGAGVFGMYRLLVLLGAPEFYDKLLCVPILNLTVRGLDRLSAWVTAHSGTLASTASRFSPKQANWAWMSVWIAFFAIMSGTGFLNKGKDHPGGNPEFWHSACSRGDGSACAVWARTLNAQCEDNSTAACLKAGELLAEGTVIPHDLALAGVSLGRACDLNSSEACAKLIDLVAKSGSKPLLNSCDSHNGAACFVIGTLYSAGKGVPQDPQLAFSLFSRSCEAGWGRGCGRLGLSYQVGQGTAIDLALAVEYFDKGCDEQNAASCYQAAEMYWQGNGLPRDTTVALSRLDRACELGLKTACAQRQKLARR